MNHSDPPIIVKNLKTERLTVTANAQNTLQHFQGASAPPPYPCLRAPMCLGVFHIQKSRHIETGVQITDICNVLGEKTRPLVAS